MEMKSEMRDEEDLKIIKSILQRNKFHGGRVGVQKSKLF